MKFLGKIFGLSLIWFGVWAFFIEVLQIQGIDYTNHYVITTVFFMLVITGLTSVFKNQINTFVEKFTQRDLLMVSIFSALMALIYFLVNTFVITPMGVDVSTYPFLLRMQESFLVSKAFEIMFQQTFFIICVYYLFNKNVAGWKNILSFGIFTLVLHIPVLFVPNAMGKTLLLSSFFAGVIFSYCITKFKKGFLYSFFIHYAFYVLLGAAWWLGFSEYVRFLI